MKKLKNLSNSYFIPLLLALLIRIYRLHLNPVGISHDEIHDLVNAKSLALIGKSAPGTIAGIFGGGQICLGNCVFGELISFLLIPWMKIFPLDIFWSKIPFVIASLLIVYFAGKLIENLFRNKQIGLTTSLLVAINPWAIHFGRTAFENLFTFAFYLWALFLFTKESANLKDFCLGFFIAILGFLSYMGAKPLFPFLIVWGMAFNLYKNKKTNLKPTIVFILSAIIMTATYLKILPSTTAGTRLKEIRSTDPSQIVDEQRRVSLQIPFVRDLAINKYTIMARNALDKYLAAFSPLYLFGQGEAGYDVFMISSHPYLYLIDAFFIIAGTLFLAQRKKKELIFLFLLLAILPIGSVVSQSGTTYGLRSGLLFPVLLGLAGAGVYSLSQVKRQRLSLISTLIIYIISFSYFSIMYFYRTPFEKSAGWFFHERVLVDYLQRNEGREITVVVSDPIDVLYLYGFYTKKYNQKEFAEQLNQTIINNSLTMDNITFTNQCLQEIAEGKTIIIEAKLKCLEYPKDWLRINEPRDNGQRFIISNDRLCEEIALNSYPYPRKIQDFDVDSLTDQEFCRQWVTDLSRI